MEIAPGIYVESDGSVYAESWADPADIAAVAAEVAPNVGAGGFISRIRDNAAERREDRQERRESGGNLRERLSMAREQSLDRRGGRVDDRQERRFGRDLGEDDTPSKGGSMRGSNGKTSVSEIVSAANGGGAAADVRQDVLMQYDGFTISKIVDNGSAAGTLIKQIWAGKKLIQDFGDGISAALFASNSNLITTQKLQGWSIPKGVNLSVVFNIPATSAASLYVEGMAYDPNAC